jgi:hypothetical protein
MDIQKFISSPAFTKVLYGVGFLVLALCIFQAGLFIGFRKAQFSGQFGDAYYKTFGGRGMGGGMFFNNDMEGGHGVAGTIVKINLPTLMIEDRDGTEKVVVLTDDTLIRRFRETLKDTDLHPKDFVVVLGSPNSASQIEAKLVRLLPPPEEMGTSSSPH